MATSSSDGSCTAPADFQLSSELEDPSNRLSANLLKCPLCHSSRRVFHCRQCVQNGDFTHSNAVYSERCVCAFVITSSTPTHGDTRCSLPLSLSRVAPPKLVNELSKLEPRQRGCVTRDYSMPTAVVIITDDAVFRFADKQMRLLRLKAARAQLEDKCMKILERRKQKDKLVLCTQRE